MITKYNDHRAAHVAHVFDWGTNVKFMHNGYEISLAADGQETIVFDKDGEVLADFYGTSAESVFYAVRYIDNLNN